MCRETCVVLDVHGLVSVCQLAAARRTEPKDLDGLGTIPPLGLDLSEDVGPGQKHNKIRLQRLRPTADGGQRSHGSALLIEDHGLFPL